MKIKEAPKQDLQIHDSGGCACGHDHGHDHGSGDCCSGHDHSHGELPVLTLETPTLNGHLSEGEARSVFLIEGMDCGDCARNVERVIGKMEGVREAQVVFSTKKMTVIHTAVDVPALIKTVDQIGYRASLVETTLQEPGINLPGTLSEFIIYGMDCADCAANVEKRLAKLEGVAEASVNFSTSKLKIRHTCPVESIIRTVDEAGYRAELQGQQASAQQIAFWEKHKRTVLTGVSGIFVGLGLLFEYGGILEKWAVPLYLLSILTGGYYTARAGFYSLKSRVMDMNFLMTVAAVGAAVIGQWAEGAVVVFLFAVGNWLQAMTMERTRKSIRSLMDLTPKEALIRRNGKEMKLPLTEIQIGDSVIVRPGERIPMDGVVTSGSSSSIRRPLLGNLSR